MISFISPAKKYDPLFRAAEHNQAIIFKGPFIKKRISNASRANYNRLNLITSDEITDFTRFSSGLGQAMEFIQNSDDKKRLRAIIDSDDRYKKVDEDTVDIINTYTNTRISKQDMKGGRIDVCTAIQGIFEDGKTEGRVEGRVEGENMLIKLLKLLVPGSKEYDKALNGTSADRKRLYKKYKIID